MSIVEDDEDPIPPLRIQVLELECQKWINSDAATLNCMMKHVPAADQTSPERAIELAADALRKSKRRSPVVKRR